jgi:hypothetical protein
MEFCAAMMNMENDDDSFSSIIFSDEATFHVNGFVNRHNVQYGEPNTHVKQQHERDSPKVH